ncbi:MAG: methyltransferase domain-containing protein [Candidatus Rifleibacteriota bacterium]
MMNNEAKQYFNRMAENWDSICQHDEEKLKKIIGLMNIKPGQKVLDVGCGTGVMLPILFDMVGKSGELVGVDYAEKMIKIARQKHKYANLKCVCEDIECIELKSGHFDHVLCYSVYPHFKDPSKTIGHLAKALVKGGRLCVCHSESRERINQCHQDAGRQVAHDVLPSAEKVAHVLVAAGLKPIEKIDNDELFVVIAEKAG